MDLIEEMIENDLEETKNELSIIKINNSNLKCLDHEKI